MASAFFAFSPVTEAYLMSGFSQSTQYISSNK